MKVKRSLSKRKGKRATSPKPKEVKEDNFALEDVDSDDFAENDEDIVLNRHTVEDDDELVDPRAAYKIEGKDNDFVDDVDQEEEALAREEQRRRDRHRTEEDFGLIEPPKPSAKKAKKAPRKNDLDALSQFLSRAADGLEAEQVVKDFASLSAEAKRAMLEKDAPEIAPMLREFDEKLSMVQDQLLPTLARVKGKELATSKGIGFLELKTQLFISYLMYVSFYLLLKAEGKPIKNNPVVGKLVEIRAQLDRLKPIEKRLHHQIARLMSRASEGGAEEGVDVRDESAAKANLAALAEGGDEMHEDGLYRPAKLAGKTKGSSADKKARDERLLQLHKKQVEAAEEEHMVRATSSRKESKQLQRAREMLQGGKLDDGFGEGDDEDIEGEVEMSLMERARARKEKPAKRELEEEEEDEEGMEEGEDFEEVEEDEEVDDDEQKMVDKFYKEELERRNEVKRKKRKLADEERAAGLRGGLKGQEQLGSRAGEVIDGHRKISKEITVNRGLVPQRNKKFKTPHLRSKHRATKQLQKRRSQVQEYRAKDKIAGKTGVRSIRADVIRSHQLS